MELDTRFQHLTRQLDIIPVDSLVTPISVIGAGAVGSLTVWALARTGFDDITVYDFDKVEPENQNCQVYGRGDVGKFKVDALAERIEAETGIRLKVHRERYTAESAPLRGVVITAVDNMAARKAIWAAHKDRAAATRAYIDPRMGAEAALVFCTHPMRGARQAVYERSLYDDAAAVNEPCTAKSTMYTALLLSGMVAKLVKDHATGKDITCVNVQWDILRNQFVFNDTSGR